ncbi:AcrR family transcriptional regulator [Nocardia sp. GAS34]|uniref:TetR/AcrR family transcriptional regulator n=1 Tax=unclassified Nocardia TaxID=2637762 RepID=UPI003D2202CF
MTEPASRRNRPYAPRRSPEQRREHVLDATLRVIVDQGIHKVSIDTVARAAGVTRPVVYSVFADSDELLRASLAREEERGLAQVAALLPLRPGDPAAAIVEFLTGFLGAVTAEPDRWRAAFLLVDSSNPTFRRHLERLRAALVGVLEDFVRATTTDRDVEMTARALHAFIWDAGRLTLAEPEAFPPERISRFAADMIADLPLRRPVRAGDAEGA